MQSIERYGVIALLFLVVTVVAVVMWDTEDVPPVGPSTHAAVATHRPGAERVAPSRPTPRAERRLRVHTEDRALVRDAAWSARKPDLPPVSALGEEPLAVRFPAPRSAPATSLVGEPPARPTSEPVAAGAAPSKRDRIYVVRPGDTLGEIALAELGTSRLWPRIVQLNPGLDPARLKVGARLVLPAAGEATAAPSGTPAAPATREAKRAPKPKPAVLADDYRVRAGDSLWRIAQRALGDGERWREILRVNPDLDANHLEVGQRLWMPAGARASSPGGPKVAKASGAAPAKRQGRVR